MENIPILLQYSGEWDDNNNFLNFYVDAILIKTYWKFEQLLREIAKQLQNDSNTIIIQYAIAQGYPPITICSDLSQNMILTQYIGITLNAWMKDALGDLKHQACEHQIFSNCGKDKLVDPKTIYTPTDIQRDIQKAYGMDLSHMQAWRSKEKAMQLLRGTPSESYKKMPTYLYMLEYTNPGSVTRLHTEGDGSFLYAFIAIYALIRGWIYCRPTVFRETYGQREGMCIVSNMHDGIWRATSIVYPEVLHCACMFHLRNNIKTNIRKSQKQIKEVYFALARAYTLEEFNRHMAELEAIDSRVKTYLTDIGYDKWSRAHSKVFPSTEFLHLVIDGQTRNVVRLHEKNFTCGRFQLGDIPCPHAMAVIQKFHIDSYKYCSDYYSIDYLLKTYEIPVNPLPDETTWQIPEHVQKEKSN
ncbi:uncharacterized protein [Nicotiana sylvestris]|uniref:uncharacterized protein n=1 Tax=Nicotiana sylvestris TaxID=4096 RepID=UPI00388CD335